MAFFITNFAHIVAQVTDSAYGPETSHLPELFFLLYTKISVCYGTGTQTIETIFLAWTENVQV